MYSGQADILWHEPIVRQLTLIVAGISWYCTCYYFFLTNCLQLIEFSCLWLDHSDSEASISSKQTLSVPILDLLQSQRPVFAFKLEHNNVMTNIRINQISTHKLFVTSSTTLIVLYKNIHMRGDHNQGRRKDFLIGGGHSLKLHIEQ